MSLKNGTNEYLHSSESTTLINIYTSKWVRLDDGKAPDWEQLYVTKKRAAMFFIKVNNHPMPSFGLT